MVVAISYDLYCLTPAPCLQIGDEGPSLEKVLLLLLLLLLVMMVFLLLMVIADVDLHWVDVPNLSCGLR